MKRVLKRILICTIILFILNNFIIGNFINNVSYASVGEEIENALVVALGTVVGLLTWPIRLVAVAIGMAVDKLMGTVAFIEGGVSESGEAIGSGMRSLIPFDILFNRINLLNINFFKMDELKEDSILYKFRTSIALWYYMMRNIAAAILLCVLVYVGIRMALSTVSAEQKASYKKMLVDWVTSLAIIFLLQYIILFTVYVNDALVGAIESVSESVDASAVMSNLASMSLTGVDISSIAATVVYCMLVFQTFGLFISYFNRMLKLAFLIIISPLITLTYSIDKMGDGKAQALNTWLKEYVFTILIQPFHCIIYMTFISVTFENLSTSSKGLATIANAIIAIICINFIKEGEKIVRKIFSFADDNSNTSLGAGLAIATMAASKSKSIGKGTRKAVNGVRNFKANIGNRFSSAKVETIAAFRMLSGRGGTNEDGNKNSFSDVKSDVRAEIADKKAKKIENKRYGVPKEKNSKVADAVNKRANQLMQSGMNAKEANARARLSIAKEVRKAKKRNEFDKNHPKISSARGTLKKARNIAKESEVLQSLGNSAKSYISAGVGTFVGSGMYANSGKMIESVIAGKAAYSGVKEYMKNSSSTLKNDVNKRLASLGALDSQQVAAILSKIPMNADKYEDPDTMKDFLKEIEKALERAGLDGNLKTNIEQTIKNMLAKNPSANINSVVNHAFRANGISNDSITDELRDATTNFATFNQEKSIYDTMKTAGDVGISPDAFINDIVKSYDSDSDVYSAIAGDFEVSDSEFIENSVNITQNDEKKEEKFVAPDDSDVEKFIKDRNEKDMQEFYKNCDKEFKRRDKEISETTDENQKKQLIAEMNQIEAARSKVQEATLNRTIDDIKRRAEKLIEDAESATDKQANKVVNDKLNRLQKDYNKLANEAKEHIKKAKGVDTKNISEQMDNLKKTTMTNLTNRIKNLNE